MAFAANLHFDLIIPHSFSYVKGFRIGEKISPSLPCTVEEGYDCSEVLVQLAAVRSALDNAGKVILQDHMRHCMVDAVAAGDMDAIEDLCQAVEKFIK